MDAVRFPDLYRGSTGKLEGSAEPTRHAVATDRIGSMVAIRSQPFAVNSRQVPIGCTGPRISLHWPQPSADAMNWWQFAHPFWRSLARSVYPAALRAVRSSSGNPATSVQANAVAPLALEHAAMPPIPTRAAASIKKSRRTSRVRSRPATDQHSRRGRAPTKRRGS